jgi:hypothetical protein
MSDKELFKGIKYNNKTFYKIACKSCNYFPQRWEVLYSMEEDIFMIECSNCGDRTIIDSKNIKDKPNKKAYNMRFFR